MSLDAVEGGGFAQLSDLRSSIASAAEQRLSLFDVDGEQPEDVAKAVARVGGPGRWSPDRRAV